MSEPIILFTKPGAVGEGDRVALAAAGVIVIEVENPHDVKLIRAHSELSGGELLGAAAKAISEITDGDYGSNVRKKFGQAVCSAILASRKATP